MNNKLRQEIMRIRFTDVYARYEQKEISQKEAAYILGCSSRTFRRKKVAYEEAGFEGILDKRIGNKPPNKIPVDEVEEILRLRQEKYFDFNISHLYDYLEKEHEFKRSYSWLKNALQSKGLAKKAKKRGKHRRKRPRKPMAGMMIHQDGSTHNWIEGLGYKPDLIITMDDATSEIYSAFLTKEEGTNSSLIGIKEVIEKKGIFSSFYVDRGSHYGYTPEAGGKVDKSRPTQVGRALQQLGIQLIHAYSPEARGRSERTFGTFQDRLVKELRLKGIKTIEDANIYLREVFVPDFNKRFSIKPEIAESAFVSLPDGVNLDDILCVKSERTVNKDNTVSYNGICLQIPENKHRNHFVKCRVMVHEYINGDIGLFHGPRKIANYQGVALIVF